MKPTYLLALSLIALMLLSSIGATNPFARAQTTEAQVLHPAAKTQKLAALLTERAQIQAQFTRDRSRAAALPPQRNLIQVGLASPRLDGVHLNSQIRLSLDRAHLNAINGVIRRYYAHLPPRHS